MAVVPSSLCQFAVRLTCNDVELLLFGQVDELNGISAYTDSKIGIFFFLGMFHAIDKLLNTKHVYIKVMRTLVEISVHHANKRIYALLFIVTEGAGGDSLCVGDTI